MNTDSEILEMAVAVFGSAPVVNRLAVRSKITGSGLCTSWSVFNHGSAQFVQVHIGAGINTVTGPEDNRVPQFVIKVGADAPASYDTPTRFQGAFWLCNSSTRDTLTAGSANCAWLAHIV